MTDALEYIEGELPLVLQILQRSDVRELEVREGGVHLRIHRSEPADGETYSIESVDVEPAVIVAPQEVEVVAPLVGTFYRAPEPDQPPLVDEGSEVEEETIVGIIEALSVLNEIQAGCRGRITTVLATDGQPVQYGQPLFQVMASG